MKIIWKPYEAHMKTFFIQRFILLENIIGLQGAALRSALMELMKAKAVFGGVFQVGPWWKTICFQEFFKRDVYIILRPKMDV